MTSRADGGACTAARSLCECSACREVCVQLKAARLSAVYACVSVCLGG